MDETFRQFAKNALASLVRAALVFAGSWLVAKGAITQEQADSFVTNNLELVIGLLLALIGAGWGIWQKWQQNKKINEALAEPTATSRAQFEKKHDAKA